MTFTLHHGDCLDVLRGIPDASVDAVVTDPPYGLAFMGKRWDYDVPSEAIWREVLRVMKPGGHLLAFAGTRTQHRMAVRIEDAGFEIRDMIAWVYGSGFPKSLDVSKAIDKAAGAEREVVGSRKATGKARTLAGGYNGLRGHNFTERDLIYQTAPATDAARQWEGWGTALKPALEPITVARKPLIGTVAQNVLAHGTGALNIDGCRVGTEDMSSQWDRAWSENSGEMGARYPQSGRVAGKSVPPGRWPANLIHDGSDEVLAGFAGTEKLARPGLRHKGHDDYEAGHRPHNAVYAGAWKGHTRSRVERHFDDTGSAARFFYCAKASKRDRGEENRHPTVKPTDLMRYLVRLVTPSGGVVLDPFCGSGSTGKACALEGFEFIGIEREAEYVEIARARIAAAHDAIPPPPPSRVPPPSSMPPPREQLGPCRPKNSSGS